MFVPQLVGKHKWKTWIISLCSFTICINILQCSTNEKSIMYFIVLFLMSALYRVKLIVCRAKTNEKLYQRVSKRTSTFQLHSLLVHSRTYLTILQLSRPFSIYHTRIWKPREHPHPSPYLTWRAQMPSGEIINVQSKIQVAHQDEANRTKERFAVREGGEERAMADFSFGISEKSQCTKSTWANRMWKVERERHREEEWGREQEV